MPVFPITFSIPEEKICKDDCPKTKVLSSLIPGNLSTYIYREEIDYYNEYKQSYFAITMKKAGWDCLRHYEILANNCIPVFVNIENCPPNTMYLCPKDLFIEANNLFIQRFMNKQLNELTEDDINEYKKLQKKLLDYTLNNLTTTKIAEYILKTTNFSNVSKILYISGDTEPDYLRCLTLHGFKTLFKDKCHDYPKIPHIYKFDNYNYKRCYGWGMTYTNLLNNSLHDNNLDNNIIEQIKNKYYDIIIYGSYRRGGMPFYDIINNLYEPEKIILFDGMDDRIDEGCYNEFNEFKERGHNIFVREL